MPITIRPSGAPDRQLDLTHALVRAVAEEIWKACGGNDALNWMEAERFVQNLARSDEVGRKSHTIEQFPSRRFPRSDPRLTQALRWDDQQVTGPLPVY